MNEKMTIRSKALVQPSTGRRVLVKVLWVAVALMIISAVVGFVTTGFNVGVLLSFVVPAMITSRFTTLEENIPHYEFFLADICFEESAMNITYNNQTQKNVSDVKIGYADIVSVKHSDQLQCFKLTFSKKIDGASNGVYHLLYMEKDSAREFQNMIEKRTTRKIVEMNPVPYGSFAF